MSASRPCQKITRSGFVLAALMSALALASDARAQAYGAAMFVEHSNLNWFEPVELDLDGQIDLPVGYFFNYDKLSWYFVNERATLGEKGLTYESEEIYAPNLLFVANAEIQSLAFANFTVDEIVDALDYDYQDDGMGGIATESIPIFDDMGVQIGSVDVPLLDLTDADNNGRIDTLEDQIPEPYLVQNGIQDALPRADFSWGDRYEFGFTNRERGWMVGILDGPEAIGNVMWGAGDGSPYFGQDINSDNPGTDPFFEDDDVDEDENGQGDGDGPTSEVFALGFGSVAVNFELSSPDILEGFRDYQSNLGSALLGTQTGPIWYIGNLGTPGDDEGIDDEEVDIPFNGSAADDIDGDGFVVSYLLVDTDGDGEGDTIAGRLIDYDDLHRFNVHFDEVHVRSRTKVDGVEWMMTHNIDRMHKLEPGRSDSLQLFYGLRILRFQDDFGFEGRGSILGLTTVDQEIDNQIFGPQVGFRWARNRGLWDFTVESRILFGYNRIDFDQRGLMAGEAIPGGTNRSATLRTTYSTYGRVEDDFSPVGEFRFEGRYKLSKGISLIGGYTIKYADNVRRASESVVWNIPDWGIRDGKRDLLTNGLNFGVEIRL